MNRLELQHNQFTIAVEWTNPNDTTQAQQLTQQLKAVPTDTKRAKDAIYLLSASDPEAALATWGTILSQHQLNVPLTRPQADLVIREAQRLLLDAAPPSPASATPGRAVTEPDVDDVAHGVGPGNPAAGGGPPLGVSVSSTQAPPAVPPIAVAIDLAAHLPSETKTKVELKKHILDLFDAMWAIDIWGHDSLVGALDSPVSALDSMKKAELVDFATAWCKRAQADLVADAPGGSR